jgi:hypothetical protein
MVGLLSRFAALFLSAALAACAATSALEPQHTQLAARNARIFILRPGVLSGGAQAVTVKINGVKVGSVANNSYLSVDRPPGRYKIEASFPLTMGNEHETEVEAGRSYYFVFNAAASAVASPGVFIAFPGSELGKQVGNTDYLTGSYLGQLDASAGPAVLSRLKPP